MRKIGLFLLAVVMVVGAVGMVGCDSGSTGSSKLTVADMAGTYAFTKITGTSEGSPFTFVPPELSGSLTLTSSGTYTGTLSIRGEVQDPPSGTCTVDDPNIYCTDTGETIPAKGLITNDGRTITLINNEVPPMTIELTKL